MNETLGSLVDVIVALIDELERAGIPYAFGGAVALGAWAEPRGTQDVDLNIWLEPDRFTPGFEALERAGVEVERGVAVEQAIERGMFVARSRGYRVDVFVPSVPFYDEALRRRCRLRFADRDTWVLSAEVLAVFKMLFYRPKDLVDVRRLLEVQVALDRGFVRRWLCAMLGEGSERLFTWDRLVAETS